MAYTEETKKGALLWLDTPPHLREIKTKAALCRKLGISSTKTIERWDTERRNVGLSKGESLAEQVADLDEIEKNAFFLHAQKRAMEPSASAKHMELFAKLKGYLVDKSEMRVKFSLDADEYARIRNEARRELEGFSSQGNREVRPVPALLPEQIRENQG